MAARQVSDTDTLDSADRSAITKRRPRRWLWMALGSVVLVAVGGVCAWAVLTVLRPVADPLDAMQHTYVTVGQGEVGSSLTLNTVAEWTPVPVGANRAVGVVTGVSVAPGDEVDQGAQLYGVNLRPVVVGEGQVPAFRAIGAGATGPDVAQLQRMLGALGHYRGTADGKAGPGTIAAVRAWQGVLGVEKTGVVEAGDIIFVPVLPTRVSLDEALVSRGLSLNGGEKVLRGLPAEPRFRLPVTDAQAGLIPTGSAVEIISPDGAVWMARTGDAVAEKESSAVSLTLSAAGKAPICVDQCGQIPVSGRASLRSRIVTVPTVTGLVVPSSALVASADGQVAVVTRGGKRMPVTVVSSAKGMSVIEGVNEGLKVRVPAKAPGT